MKQKIHSRISMLPVFLAATLFAFPVCSKNASGQNLTEDAKLITPDGAYVNFGYCVAVENDRIAVGQMRESEIPCSSCSVHMFHRENGIWVAKPKIRASDWNQIREFARAISIAGDFVAVGAQDMSTSLGAVYVFHWDGASWIESDKLVAWDGAGSSYFGWSVAIDQDALVVGDKFGDPSGVYVFRRTGDHWTPWNRLSNPDDPYALLGASVAIDGNYLVAGEPLGIFNNARPGVARVYRQEAGTWILDEVLGAEDGLHLDGFGISVAIAGERLVVGQSTTDHSREGAYIFQRSTGGWAQAAKLDAFGQEPGYLYFGHSLSISGDRLVVGAANDGYGGDPWAPGAAYTFHLINGEWVPECKLVASGPTQLAGFGLATAIDKNYCVVGANYATGSMPYSGAAYIFDKDADGDSIPGAWEVCGIPVDASPLNRYYLPGADPHYKDLYVETDAMAGVAPAQSALTQVVAAFRDSPVSNPDQVPGIRLHIIGGPGDDQTRIDEDDLPPTSDWPYPPFTEFDALKAQYFGTRDERLSPLWTVDGEPGPLQLAKARAYRYCIFADHLGGNGQKRVNGVAKGGGLRAAPISSLRWAGLKMKGSTRLIGRRGVFMHELGHGLGLGHGGDQNYSWAMYKPNYFSVMNYLWDVRREPGYVVGVTGRLAADRYASSWRLDYSRGTQPSLIEDCVEERASGGAIPGDPSTWVPVGPPVRMGISGFAQLVQRGLSWDLDRNGNMGAGCAEPVDTNYFIGLSNWSPPPGLPLNDYDDWGHLIYLPDDGGVGSRIGDAALAMDPEDEPTIDDFITLSSLRYDCNGNGEYDDEEIDNQTLADENHNGIPDICEGLPPSGAADPGDGSQAEAVLSFRNPTDGQLIGRLNLENGGHVRACVCDASGRVICTLVDAELGPGAHEITADACGEQTLRASGLYFVDVTVGTFHLRRQVVVLR